MEQKTINQLGKLVAIISQIKTPSFIRIINYSNEKGQGEIANYTINLGISYENAKASDIAWLRDEKNLLNVDFGSRDISIHANTARNAMLFARLNTSRQSIAQTNTYETLCPNVRLHKEKQRIYIFAFVVRKDIVKTGNYKPVDSDTLTIAKRKIEDHLKATQFRQFCFDKLKSVKVKGEEITITLE